jgi:hypothetical protein
VELEAAAHSVTLLSVHTPWEAAAHCSQAPVHAVGWLSAACSSPATENQPECGE